MDKKYELFKKMCLSCHKYNDCKSDNSTCEEFEEELDYLEMKRPVLDSFYTITANATGNIDNEIEQVEKLIYKYYDTWDYVGYLLNFAMVDEKKKREVLKLLESWLKL